MIIHTQFIFTLKVQQQELKWRYMDEVQKIITEKYCFFHGKNFNEPIGKTTIAA
jgi:hypothetical protein